MEPPGSTGLTLTGNDLLLVLEVRYGIFCDRSTGNTFVPSLQSPLGSGSESALLYLSKHLKLASDYNVVTTSYRVKKVILFSCLSCRKIIESFSIKQTKACILLNLSSTGYCSDLGGSA